MKILQTGSNNFRQKTEENLSLHSWKQGEYQIKLSKHQNTPPSNRPKWLPNFTSGS